MSHNFSYLELSTYDGTTDSSDHLSSFVLKMQLINASDADRCRAFPVTFGGQCHTWYTSLTKGVINTFEQFAILFASKYTSHKRRKLAVLALINSQQGKSKALFEFFDRWNSIAS
ncbi:unnamed protein product [Linum trigynum]|uniref:Retrotransposon gag domain-containing protein n=1 Tax=Linum trigynum TaxID=586398 RepID=A0AAV2GV35_9ROSI